MGRLAEADCILICVPTPLSESRDPDLSLHRSDGPLDRRARLRPGQLVVLESTTYPGTTRDVVLPILDAAGLAVRRDFFLALQPRARRPGNPTFRPPRFPRSSAASTPRARDLACAVTARGREGRSGVELRSRRGCKILENTYRAVNIALVNELKMLYDRMGIDVWEVIDAAKTKPFGFQAFYPGPGLGGHCIPIDPFYLSWVARQARLTTRFIELAGEINTRMPAVRGRAAGRSARTSGGKPVNGSKVAILGMAYKKDVDDPRESPSFELMELLRAQGGRGQLQRSAYPDTAADASLSRSAIDEEPRADGEYLGAQDCVLIATDHSAYDYDFIVQHSRLVLDTRNATSRVVQGRDKIRKA